MSTSKDGTRVVTGNERSDINVSNDGSLRVYIYNSSSQSWSQLGSTLTGYETQDRVGYRVGISGDGNTIVHCASNESSAGNSFAQVYTYIQAANEGNGDWFQKGTDFVGTTATRYGWACKLDYDGDTVILGSPYYSVGRIYKYINNKWEQVGPDFTFGSNSGSSTAISDDGMTFAVGASGTTNGHAGAYILSTVEVPTLNIQDGNVGVGTTSPNEKLELNGRLRINGSQSSPGIWFYGNNYDNDTNNVFFGRGGSTFDGIGFWFSNWQHVFLNNGNVGIGTTSPASTLDVNGPIRSGYDSETISFFGRAAVGSTSSYGDQAYFGHLDQISTGTYGNYAILQNSSGETFLNYTSGQAISFRENNNTQMTLKAGYFGIGTTTPSYPLDVNGIVRTRGTHTSTTDGPYYDSGFYTNYILAGSTNNGTSTLRVGTYNNERISITHNYERSHTGQSIYMGGIDFERSGVNGRIRFRKDEVILANGAAVSSDGRLTQNEKLISDGISIVKQMIPKTYDMTDDMYDASYNGPLDKYKPSAGYIAQDIQVIPDLSFCVIDTSEYDDSGNLVKLHPLAINYTCLMPYHTAAIKQQQEQIEIEKAKVTILESENTNLKAQITDILQRLSNANI